VVFYLPVATHGHPPSQTEASRGVMSEGARGARKPLIDDRTVSSLFDDVDSLVEAVLNRL
jgi:hypothetical protein